MKVTIDILPSAEANLRKGNYFNSDGRLRPSAVHALDLITNELRLHEPLKVRDTVTYTSSTDGTKGEIKAIVGDEAWVYWTSESGHTYNTINVLANLRRI